MKILRKLAHLLPSRRNAMEQDMRDELESLAAIAQAEGGRRDLGNLTRAAEEARAAWGWVWIEQLWGDVRNAFRTMRRNPGFAATAVVSLAFGIGANIAVFNLVNAIVLKPLPVSHRESLAALASYSKEERVGSFGYPDYLVLRAGNRAFTGLMAASNLGPGDLAVAGETEVVQRKIVSSSYFSVLDVQPLLGRVFNAEDEEQQVAVISHGLWSRRFGSSPSVLGQQVELDGLPFSIIGVAPRGFFGETVGEAPDVWATVALMPASRRNGAGFTWLNLMGRLKPGINLEQAAADLRSFSAQLPNNFIDRIGVESGRLGGAGLRNTFSFPLKILMALVGLVLLIACANLAALLLARAAARQRETATCLAIGASRLRVVRRLMTESVLLGLLGGLSGLVVAYWTDLALLKLVAGVGRTVTVELWPDMRVLLFGAAVSIGAGGLFGLAPAVGAVRANVGESLKLTARHFSGRRRRWGLKDGLIAMQVALSFVLLVVGGLFLRTVQNLRTQDVGFHAAQVLCVEIGLQRGYRPDWAKLATALLERAEGVPGVQSAGASANGILSNHGSGVNGFKVEGHAPSEEGERARANWVTPGYFETAGIPLLEGRAFSRADDDHAAKVAIVNLTMARYYFGGESAIGRRFEFNGEQYEIVGVAADAKYQELRESTPRFVYFAAVQSGSALHSLEVRTSGSPLGVAGAVREAIRAADPGLRVGDVATLETLMDRKLAREFLVTDIAGFFGGLTLLLVAVGVYGTLAYSVARRTDEIGLRVALGARAPGVLRLVLGDILVTLLAGLGAGLVAALAAGRLVASMLFGLEAADPTTIALAAFLMTAATLAAGYIPARRALRVEPMAALRSE